MFNRPNSPVQIGLHYARANDVDDHCHYEQVFIDNINWLHDVPFPYLNLLRVQKDYTRHGVISQNQQYQ
jgi:hypothetical protein